MAQKTKEELEKEQKEAKEKLDALLSASRPKNLRDGVSHGVSNILGGAVGGVGIAVMAPTMGLAVGLQNGGIIGGALGVTGGAIVGAVGAVGLIVGGALSGVTSIVRGAVAAPKAIMATRQGKWWNEASHQWILTDLTKVQVPDSDADLLKSIEDKIDGSIKDLSGGAAAVKDTYYYDMLEVDPKAEPSAIKRKYYILARKYHPDKVGPDDTEAADKFKEIAEAYQVLSDPALRDKYDKDGKDALTGDKTGINDDHSVDPTLLLAFLFGSDRFKDYIGRLATSTSAMLGDSPQISMQDARTLQERRCTRLALKLAAKIEPWVKEDYDMCKTLWATEASDLSTASYGWELVKVIGMAYEVTALQFLGCTESGIGMPSISKWATAQQARSKMSKVESKGQFDTMMASLDAMKIQQEYQAKLAKAETDGEKMKLEHEMQKATQGVMLKIIWTTTTVDITSTIHEACQMVFYDHSVDKAARERRAHAVKNLGEIFQACPKPEGLEEKDAQTLFEEASMAAMLETMQRKDEATFSASYGH